MSFRAALCLLACACTEGLERRSEVRDLRILAVRADPPELLDGELPDVVRFSALAVNPKGEPIDLTWQVCPMESSAACRDFEASLAEAPAGLPAAFFGATPSPCDDVFDDYTESISAVASALLRWSDPEHFKVTYRAPKAENGCEAGDCGFDWGVMAQGDITGGSVDLGFIRDLARDLAGCDPARVPPGLLDLTLPSALTDLHGRALLQDPLGGLVDYWPAMMVTARSGPASVLAQKRLPVRFAQPAGVLGVLSLMLGARWEGLPFCVGAGGAGCISVPDRAPNTNPEFSDVRVREGSGALGGFLPWPRSGLVLAPGESVRILPVFTDESFETYDDVEFGAEDRTIRAVSKVEEITVSWFSNAGEIQDDLTWPKQTKTLDTVFTAPETMADVPERGAVDLWLVARDPRGGTAWVARSITIEHPKRVVLTLP